MAEAAGQRSVPSEQRIFSLVLALVASPEGLTKRQLLSSVYGYSERFDPTVPSFALDRQFERDKEQLRALGIQVDTLDSPLEPGNNQLTRYRISKERLEFPAGLRFSERELMLLRVAALAWSEGSLNSESRRATIKLEALGAGLDVQHLGVAPRLGTAEPAAGPLQQAIDDGVTARFAYTLPGRDAPLERWVAPLRLHRADGRWHLIAWDLDREAGRVFLLSRVEGAVRVTSDRFDPQLFECVDEIIAGLLQQRDHNVATLEVRRGSIAEARLAPRARSSSDGEHASRMSLDTLDIHVLAEELVGFGPDVVVLEPEQLRELVLERLRAVATSHAVRHHPANGVAHDR